MLGGSSEGPWLISTLMACVKFASAIGFASIRTSSILYQSLPTVGADAETVTACDVMASVGGLREGDVRSGVALGRSGGCRRLI